MTRADAARATMLLAAAIETTGPRATASVATHATATLHACGSPDLTPGQRADWFYVLCDAVFVAWRDPDALVVDREDAADRITLALGFLTFGLSPERDRRVAA